MPNELIEQLRHSRSEKRSSAAKRLRKLKDPQAGPALLESLEQELKDPRTWKAQFEMILALGELRYEPALPKLWELTRHETPHTIVYMALGDAIVRISSQGPSDARAIFQLGELGNYSLIHGALNAMSELRLVPSDEEIERILQLAEDPRADVEVQRFPNDRVGLRLDVALAAAGWPRELVRPFLDRCLTIPDQGLQLAATNSLKGKYTKWASL
jgi:HEAT repeat protein